MPFTGTIYGEVVPFDRSFVDNDNISINNNLDAIRQILNQDSKLSASTKLAISVFIDILKNHYYKLGLENDAYLIDDEVTTLISAINGDFSDSYKLSESSIYPLFFKITSQLEGVPLSNHYLDNTIADSLNPMITRVKSLGLIVTKEDLLDACYRILNIGYLTMFPISDLEMILETEKYKLSGTSFFLRTHINTFLNAYIVKFFYDNPYFRGTITPVIDNSHGTIDHQDTGRVIVQLQDELYLPKCIKIKADNNNDATISSASSDSAKINPQIDQSERGPISDMCSFKEGKSRILLKVTADKDGELKAASFFSSGLIRLESLHKMISGKHTEAGKFCAKHYKLLFEHLMDLYKGKQGTLTFRLTEITKEKTMNGLSENEDKESLDYLLNTQQGLSILKMDIELILRLKNKGLDVELLVPNVANAGEIIKVKEIIKEVQERLVKSGISTQRISLGAMVENPLILQDIANIEQEVSFLSLGVNDMTNTYDALKRDYPEIFNEKGLLDISKLTTQMIKSAANRVNGDNKSPRDVFLTSDFINFLKINLFDKTMESRKIRACGNIDKYIATILAGMKVTSISANHYELENIYFFIKNCQAKYIYDILEAIYTSSGYDNQQEIQNLLSAVQ